MDGGSIPKKPKGRAAQALSPLAVGAIVGISEVAQAISFVALIFSGTLAMHLKAGIGLALMGATVTMVVLGVGSSLKGAVATVQDITAAVMALMAAGIAGLVPPTSQTALYSLIIVIAGSTLVAGIFLWLIGTLRWGNFARFIPHPVMGGFLAGTGWILLIGGIGVMAGAQVNLSGLPGLMLPGLAPRWVPGLAFGLALWFIGRRFGKPIIVPMAIVGSVAAFFVFLFVSGIGVGGAASRGWLIGPFPSGQLWRFWMVDAVRGADWSAIGAQLPALPSLIALAVLSLLLNVSGLELASHSDVDLNRELRVTGVANVISGAAGGMLGFHAMGLTLLARASGARSRSVSLVAAAVVAIVLVAGASVVSMVPKWLLGGILVVPGFGLLYEWVVDARHKLPLGEYFIVLLILLVIATTGFLQGMAVGTVAAVALFVVEYSRQNVVKHHLNGHTYRAKVDREPSEHEKLRELGDEICLMELQGFIFFGTAHGLNSRILERVNEAGRPLQFMVLDFRRVSGLDSSAAASFRKAYQMAESRGFDLVLTGMREPYRQRILSELGSESGDRLHVFDDLDHGFQWCEDQILACSPAVVAPENPQLAGLLEQRLGDTSDIDTLITAMERIEIPKGYRLITQGEPSDDLYFLESGRLTVTLEGPEDSIRLRTMGQGCVVGEVSMYLGTPRTATVTSDCPCVLRRLSRNQIDLLSEQNPATALALHQFFATLLAERLNDTLRTVDALRG